MKKLLFSLFPLLLCLCLAFPSAFITASADTGPKPSVQITFKGLSDTPCYGTLLSQQPSAGPHFVWTSEDGEPFPNTLDNPDVWQKFVNYQDEDGFYFLQWAQKIDDATLSWTYYPPSTFKALLYFPETDEFLVSEIYESYAFDSYYAIDVSSLQEGKLTARRSYDYGREILSLLARITLTIAVETLLAWLLGFRSKKEFLLLILINCLTQIGLNVYLNVVLFQSGALAFLLSYIYLEVAVVIVEAILYCIFLRRAANPPKRKLFYILYALIANLLSFGMGIFVARFLPNIF